MCPTCRGQQEGVTHPLWIREIHSEQGPHILQGVLECSNPVCRREYPVLDGIPMLVAALRTHVEHNALGILLRDDLSPRLESILGDCAGPNSPLDVLRQHISHYAADHYGDLDPDLSDAQRQSAAGILRLLGRGLELLGEVPAGPVLDMGCSVGRTSFELASQTGDLVVGMDLNFSMLRVAARVLREGRVRYGRRRVGVVYDRREYDVELAGADRVDFWQCDALALPFELNHFGLISSLNLLDCLPFPVSHIHSLPELMRPEGRAMVATPYDWSPAATAVEAWIGGHSQRGPERGASEVFMQRLLEGGEGVAGVGLKVLAEDLNVPWAVRLHDRSTSHYESHVMVIGKA